MFKFISETLDNQSTNATSYEWDFGDGTTSTDIDLSHTYTTSGIHTVTLIAHHCDYSDTIVKMINSNITSIQDNSPQNSIALYPNPVSDQLTVSLEKVDRMYVVNTVGKIFTPTYATIGTSTLIDFSNFASGIYFLVLESDGQSWKQKVVKE